MVPYLWIILILLATILSARSSIPCKSQSISGRCATGRHTDRNKNVQKKFKRALVVRDVCCIATGVTENLVGAHIVPLSSSQLVTRELLFSPKNGVLLHKDLEDDYDLHKWIFDPQGKVSVLFPNWSYRRMILEVSISKGATWPSPELIQTHNNLALAQKEHHCPHCWKYVGNVNVENHKLGSCEAIDRIDDDDESGREGDDE